MTGLSRCDGRFEQGRMIVATQDERGAPGGPGRQPEQEIRSTGERLRQQAEQAGRTAAGRAEERVEQQKDHTAERIENVAEAFSGSAERLRGEEDWLAEGIGTAASSLEEMATKLRQKRAVDFLADLEEIGRQRPALLFGTAVALGFGAARLARSSRERRLRESYGRREAVAGMRPNPAPAPSPTTGPGGTSPASVRGAGSTI